MISRIFTIAACALLAAASAQAQEAGKKIFEGKGNCISCHGAGARGTRIAPNLRDAIWLNIDGSREQVRRLVRTGVSSPKRHPVQMPPMGGANLSADELDAVVQYVVALRTEAPDVAGDVDSDTTALASDSAGCACCGGMRGQARGALMCGMHRCRMHAHQM